MNEKEKSKKIDALDELHKRIGACFGCEDNIFAGHQFDEDQAKDFRKLAYDNKITLYEMKEIALGYLYLKKGCHIDHIEKQMNKIDKFFAKKLKERYDE